MIPRILWQTYISSDLPLPARSCQRTWITKNHGFSYRFLDDRDIDRFTRETFDDETYRVFRSFPLGVMRADFWRYAALYFSGGVYADIDSACVQPVDTWGLDEEGILIGLENDTHFCNWCFASAPGHPVLATVLEKIVERGRGGIDTTNEHFVHAHTGPGIWTEAIGDVIGMAGKTSGEMVSSLVSEPELKRKVDRLRIRIVPQEFFNGTHVRNLYGSVHFGDGYVSWTRERRKILQGDDRKMALRIDSRRR